MTLKLLATTIAAALLALGMLAPSAQAASKADKALQKMHKKVLANELASDARPAEDADAPADAAEGGLGKRSWVLSPLFIEQLRVDFLGADPAAESTNEEERDAIEMFLRGHGVPFPAGSKMSYNHCGSLVTITNTPANLEAVNAALLEHGPAMLDKAQARHKGGKKGKDKKKPKKERSSKR